MLLPNILYVLNSRPDPISGLAVVGTNILTPMLMLFVARPSHIDRPGVLVVLRALEPTLAQRDAHMTDPILPAPAK